VLRFTGDEKLKVGGDDHMHMVDPEQLIHVLMARQ
jgi:hypothetical protein